MGNGGGALDMLAAAAGVLLVGQQADWEDSADMGF
jgi:hypothetical protein